MKVKTITKIVAVLMFIIGALVFAEARLNKPAKPKPFVVVYRLMRTDTGKPAAAIGFLTAFVNADGTGKQERFTVDGADVRYLDATAAYKLAGDHLDYLESADTALTLDRYAQEESWLNSTALDAREATVLGLKCYMVHQELSDGWWEGTFSTATRHTPLIDREQHNGVITSREALSVQFRDVTEETAVPDLPISFERAQKLEQAFRLGDDEARKQADGIAERMRSVRNTLRSRHARVE